jgi:uridine kinase
MHIICEGKELKFPNGTTLMDIWNSTKQGRPDDDAILANCDGVLCGMNTKVKNDTHIQWVPLTAKPARQAYQRTMIMLLVSAMRELYGQQDEDVEVKHSLGGSLYCEFPDKHVPLSGELRKLEDCMKKIVAEARPIIPRRIGTKRAITYLKRKGRKEDAELLSVFSSKYLGAYECGNLVDFYFGPLLPNMGYIKHVDLFPYAPGFLMACEPEGKPKGEEDPLFAKVFLEAEEWASLIGCSDVAELNRIIHQGKAKDLIAISEALQEKKIAGLADRICSPSMPIRMVCIAGPSSSGKTTFMSRLLIHLRVNGVRPVQISLDDFFRDRDELTKEKNIDFEDLHAIDVPLFQKTIVHLLEGHAVRIPKFNFKTGKREWQPQKVKLETGQPVLVEGLHALNPELTRFVPGYQCMHVYLSSLTQLSISAHNRISTSDARLIRRLVRDSWSRSNGPRETLAVWGNVRRGEERNIFNFQNRADVIFNSSLIYELPVLKTMAVPLLMQISPEMEEYPEAQRLLQFLDVFREIPVEWVPDNSILREFIGPRKVS